MKRAILMLGCALCFAVFTGVATAQPSDGAAVAAERQLYAIVYRAGPAWLAGRPMQEQGLQVHGAYWSRLFDEGRVHAAGPFGADGGLVLLYADDLADAERIVAEDPAVIAGQFIGETRRYQPRFLRTEPLTDRRR